MTNIKTVLNTSTAIAPEGPPIAPIDEGAALAEAKQLQQRWAVFAPTLRSTEREKDKFLVEMWQVIDNNGGPEEKWLNDACKMADINSVSKEIYFCAVQFMELNASPPIAKLPSEKARKNRRNIVTRRAQAMAALHFFANRGAFDGWTADQIVDWFEENGRTNGVIGLHRQEMGGKAKDENEEGDPDFDIGPFEKALANGFALDFDQLNAVAPTLGLLQHIDGKLRVLALSSAPTSLLGALTDYLPAPDGNLTSNMRFWSNVARLALVIPVKPSGELLDPSADVHVGSLKLRSFPMAFYKGDGEFFVSPSRQSAGIVITAKAREDTGMPVVEGEPIHLETKGFSTMQEKLSSPVLRAAFDLPPEKRTPNDRAVRIFRDNGNGADYVTLPPTDGDTVRVKLLPMSKFGSSPVTRQWALNVSPKYSAKANSLVEQTDGGLAEKLVLFASKASGSKHPVKVTIKAGVLSLKLGTSASFDIASSGEGAANVDVHSGDFASAIGIIAELNPVSGIMFRVDPSGLVELNFEDAGGEYSVFIPTLLDKGDRNPALFDVVERTRPAEVVADQELAEAI